MPKGPVIVTRFVAHPGPVALTPREALRRLRGRPGLALLESAGVGGRFSLLTSDPLWVLGDGKGGEGGKGGGDTDPFLELETLLSGLHMPTPPEGVPFAGGLIGYLGYEAGDWLERLPEPQPDDLHLPAARFAVHDWALIWANGNNEGSLVASVLPGDGVREGARFRTRGRVELERWLAQVAGWLSSEGEREQPPQPLASTTVHAPPQVIPSLHREGFMAGVERIREYILAGDLFQANLTRRISLSTQLDGVELYLRMATESPAPFGAFLQCDEFAVASISPESFLTLRGREVETRPIKGTAARGRTPREDAFAKESLLTSEKDRAENVMIVDLLRNDLSRVCEDDSVEVPKLLELESHPTVHHLVSTVTGTLRDTAGPLDLLRATFPGGSITGAPKIRAIEILRELEPHRRHVYTGALGVVGFHGDMELSIVIRTAVLKDGWAHYGTGGGITLASDPSAEWDETEAKAAAFRRALAERVGA